MSPGIRQERGSARRQSADGKNRFDKALISARASGRKVVLTLALETPLTDAEGEIAVEIVEVDTYAIKVKTKMGKEIWISKGFIVQTEIL